MIGLSVIIPVKDPEPYLPILEYDLNNLLSDFIGKQSYEILIQKEKGLTNAIIKGVARAGYNMIGVIDADGSHHPIYLPVMYDLCMCDSLDLVVGSKWIDQSALYRRIISKSFNALSKAILNIDVSDTMSGLVVGRKTVFQKLKANPGYKFVLQLLTVTPKEKILEFPIVFRPRKEGESKASIITAIQTIKLILELRRNGEIEFE